VSKVRRISPTRATGASTAVGKAPPLDLLQAAADIIAALPDAVVVTGTDRRVLAANATGAELLGWALNDVVGQAIAEHVPPGERAHVAAREDKVLAGEPQRYETRIVNHRTNEERDVAVSSGPFRVNGELIGTVATLRDVTEPKRAQETLARSEARYRHLVESASDAIVTLDANGRFTTVNHAAENISGYKREELVGQWFAPMLPDDDLPKALGHFQQALAGETGLFDSQFYRKDGEVRTISITYSTPQKDEEVLCLIRDVTDQKMLQEQLIQSEKMSAIGQLVSGVAHELNNPLAGISAFAQLLLAEKRFPPDQRTAAETIYSEARRASRIVQNLLTFARQHKAEKVPTAINQVLDDTLELRGYELRVRGIDVRREYDESIPDTMADAHQLQQVFLNLITNAEQAMEQRDGHHHRLTVTTRRNADAIRIEVEDTGAGIPANLIERIFNPFFTTKPTGSGTGLGLSISLGIVREHEGKIWAENSSQSAGGGGARFVVEIPITEPRRSGEHTEVAHVEAQSPDSLRVLVIDDEASVRVSLQRYLAAKGHQVETTASGEDGLLRLKASKYDAVILDMRMPDLSGEQLYERLRSNDPSHAERVIFTTGDLVNEQMRRFLDGTGRPCVAKPFEFASFDQALPAARRRA